MYQNEPQYNSSMKEYNDYHHVATQEVTEEGENPDLTARLMNFGASIDQTLETHQASIYHLYLACCVFALVGFSIAFIVNFMAFNFIMCTYYLFSAGLCLLIGILNFPNLEQLHVYRSQIRSAFRFASLVFGQAVIFIYLGISIYVSVWPEKKEGARHSALLITTTLITGTVCLLGGLVGLFVALAKRRTLETIRLVILGKMRADPSRDTEQLITDILNNNKSPHHNFSVAEFPCFIGCFTREDLPMNVPSLTDSALLFNSIDTEGNGYLTVTQVADWIDTATPLV